MEKLATIRPELETFPNRSCNYKYNSSLHVKTLFHNTTKIHIGNCDFLLKFYTYPNYNIDLV